MMRRSAGIPVFALVLTLGAVVPFAAQRRPRRLVRAMVSAR